MPAYWTDKTPRYRIIEAGIDRFFIIERDCFGEDRAINFFADRSEAEAQVKALLEEWDDICRTVRQLFNDA